MSNTVDAPHRRLPSFLGGLGLGSVVTALVGLFAVDEVREDFCQAGVPRIQANLPGCGDKFEPIAATDAELPLALFYGRAGGADPSLAWDMLSIEAQQQVGRDQFMESWDGYYWAELVQDIEPIADRFNTFTIHVRYYGEGGTVTERRNEVALTSSGGRIVVQSESRGSRTQTAELDFPNVRLTRPENTYQQPSLESDVAMFSTEVDVGGTLTVLCRLDPGNAEAPQAWLRTPQGWIVADAMEQVAPESVVTCDPRYHRTAQASLDR